MKHFDAQYDRRMDGYQLILQEAEARRQLRSSDPRVHPSEPLHREVIGKVSKLLSSLKPNTGGMKSQHPIANHTLEREPAG